MSHNLISELYHKEYQSAEEEIKPLSHIGLTTAIVFIFLLRGMLEMGKKLEEKKKNDVIQNYFYCVRNKHAIYNLNKILVGLRLTIIAVLMRFRYRKAAAVNYAQQSSHGTAKSKSRPIQEIVKNKFLVMWLKWIGGIITNFKRVAKRVISRMLNDNVNKKTENTVDYFIAFPQGVPRLPAIMINATDNHWALNEGKRMGLATVQVLETSYRGFFGDCNLAINTHYLGLLIFTGILLETHNWQEQYEKVTHRQKLVDRVSAITKRKETQLSKKLWR